MPKVSPTLRRLFSSIAILAMLLNLLAPGVSQALASRDGAGWVEICGAQGSRWIRQDGNGTVVEQSDSRPDDVPSLHHEACGYCVTHAASFALPPVAEGLLPMSIASATDALPADPPSDVLTRHAWDHPAVRAPPTFRPRPA